MALKLAKCGKSDKSICIRLGILLDLKIIFHWRNSFSHVMHYVFWYIQYFHIQKYNVIFDKLMFY